MEKKAIFFTVFLSAVFTVGSQVLDGAAYALIPVILVLPVIFLAIDYLRSKEPTFSHKLALKKYIFFRLMYVYGFYLTRKLKKDSSDIRSTQEKALLTILKLNATSEYSKKWKLDGVKTREEFRQVHPICKIQQFKTYIERTAQGEKNVLISQTPEYFNTTSGTMGNPNLIPIVRAQMLQYLKFVSLMIYNVVTLVSDVAGLKRSMKIYYNPQRCLDRTPSGVLAGPATANPLAFHRDESFTSPPAAFDIDNENHARYIHVLFGLRHRHLTKIETIFMPIVYQAMEEIEKEWKNLVDDIRNGTLKADLNIPIETRKLLEQRLSPDPERADELETEFKKGFRNIAKRIWPKLENIFCVNGGPFVNYTNLTREKYTGDVLIYDPIYAASESLIGVNIWPLEKSSYFLWPWMVFFEFVKVKDISEDQPDTLFMDQLEIGEQYEVILTTCGGLTRYRFGDVVKVVKFCNQLPIVEFQYRSGHLMNIRGEKMSELTFIEALNSTVAQMTNVELALDYTMCTSISLPDELHVLSGQPYYVLFVELITTGSDYKVLERQLSEEIDAKVVDLHVYYRFYRGKNALGQLKVYLIKPGGFARLRQFMLDTSKTSPSQIKVPHVLTKPALVNFLYGEKIIDSK